jgi:NAD-dependent histone deacetylase SIR2
MQESWATSGKFELHIPQNSSSETTIHFEFDYLSTTSYIPYSTGQALLSSDLSDMSDGTALHELSAGETYQIDSDEFDSDDQGDNIGEEDYDELVAEGESH